MCQWCVSVTQIYNWQCTYTTRFSLFYSIFQWIVPLSSFCILHSHCMLHVFLGPSFLRVGLFVDLSIPASERLTPAPRLSEALVLLRVDGPPAPFWVRVVRVCPCPNPCPCPCPCPSELSWSRYPNGSCSIHAKIAERVRGAVMTSSSISWSCWSSFAWETRSPSLWGSPSHRTSRSSALGDWGDIEVARRKLVLWLCAMLLQLYDVVEEDKKTRAFWCTTRHWLRNRDIEI